MEEQNSGRLPVTVLHKELHDLLYVIVVEDVTPDDPYELVLVKDLLVYKVVMNVAWNDEGILTQPQLSPDYPEVSPRPFVYDLRNLVVTDSPVAPQVSHNHKGANDCASVRAVPAGGRDPSLQVASGYTLALFDRTALDHSILHTFDSVEKGTGGALYFGALGEEGRSWEEGT
eukprot:CAMPEP_0118655018 /NCGR_PEP_ID=MMETSP0785-20121206/12699_1 /TAXON_ID=91992 /ORGANISM="Bolidomonas pacifica, Strain CCMP 1866" /LENGTH=172 /DNA_ID=CAMNT_0006547717 /DNA_START=273 /DNA_END=792 /DNA_ORIENTATION=+